MDRLKLKYKFGPKHKELTLISIYKFRDFFSKELFDISFENVANQAYVSNDQIRGMVFREIRKRRNEFN
jgi:hypothetical protein